MLHWRVAVARPNLKCPVTSLRTFRIIIKYRAAVGDSLHFILFTLSPSLCSNFFFFFASSFSLDCSSKSSITLACIKDINIFLSMMLFPHAGTSEDVRNWLYDELAATLPPPLDLLQLKSDIDQVNIRPFVLLNCSVRLANDFIKNREYAAYTVACLPPTPSNAAHQEEAWNLIVSFLILSNDISLETHFYSRTSPTYVKSQDCNPNP